jgi:hypothetical protein
MKKTCLSLLLLCICGCNSAGATSLHDLLEKDQLRLRSWLEPTGNIVVGQEVRLMIEIATRRWFAGGTRIRHPEVHNLVILQRDQFATNLSRQKNGQTWVIQQWNLELYPQLEGAYQIPTIQLELAVNHASAGIVRGSLQTTALAFSASVPTLLRETDSWLATPLFEVDQSFDRELSQLQPGDAFTRTISLRATHVTAMMLPVPAPHALPGLSAYPANPVLQDRSNRGQATAERIEKITYMVEQAGQYQLPAQEFYWWDTTGLQVQIVSLATVDIDAGAAAAVVNDNQGDVEIRIQLRWLLIPLALLLVLVVRKRWQRRPTSASGGALLRAANRALREGDPGRALQLLYAWLNSEHPAADWLSLRESSSASHNPALAGQVDAMLAAGYGRQQAVNGREDLRGLQQKAAGTGWRRFLPGPVRLQLNPGNNAGEQKASG